MPINARNICLERLRHDMLLQGIAGSIFDETMNRAFTDPELALEVTPANAGIAQAVFMIHILNQHTELPLAELDNAY